MQGAPEPGLCLEGCDGARGEALRGGGALGWGSGYEHPRPGRVQARMLRGMLLVRRGPGGLGSGTGKPGDIICKLLGVEVSRNIFLCVCVSVQQY